MNREQIKTLIPHRDPFLFLDRIIELDPGKSAVAEWDVPTNTFWTEAHFPGQPVLPGVLQAEALAQAAAVAYLSGDDEQAGKIVYLVGFDKLRFRRVVKPGETLRLQVELTANRRQMCTFSVKAFVGEERAVTGSILATIGQ